MRLMAGHVQRTSTCCPSAIDCVAMVCEWMQLSNVMITIMMMVMDAHHSVKSRMDGHVMVEGQMYMTHVLHDHELKC